MSNNWACYLIYSLDSGHTYIGSSNNPERRLHDHNCTKKGAKRTRGQTWVHILTISGFTSKNSCLSFEAGWKRCSKYRNKRKLITLSLLTDISYSKDPKHNRIIDLIYFLHNTTLLGTHFVLDPKGNKPLLFPDLTIDVFSEVSIIDLYWPFFVTIQMI